MFLHPLRALYDDQPPRPNRHGDSTRQKHDSSADAVSMGIRYDSEFDHGSIPGHWSCLRSNGCSCQISKADYPPFRDSIRPTDQATGRTDLRFRRCAVTSISYTAMIVGLLMVPECDKAKVVLIAMCCYSRCHSISGLLWSIEITAAPKGVPAPVKPNVWLVKVADTQSNADTYTKDRLPRRCATQY